MIDSNTMSEDLPGLREAIRRQGMASEDTAATRLLHSLELTGGARHRAVAVAMSIVAGARARRDERPFLDAFFARIWSFESRGASPSCASPKPCCASPMMQRRTG